MNAGAIAAIHSSEDPEGRNLTGIFRRKTLLDQRALGFYHAGSHLILELLVLGCRRHFYGAVDQEKTRSGEVSQLTARLHHHVDTRPSQFFRRDELQVRHPSESVA